LAIMSNARRRSGAHVVIVAASVAVLVAASASPGFGAAPKKNWSFSLASASPAPENDSKAFFGGQTVQVAVTITDMSSKQSLGSANILIPSDYTPVSLDSVVTNPPGKDWSPSTLAGYTIQLRNSGPSKTQALTPGQSLTATVSVTTECTPNTSSTWNAYGKQSNDFSGTGNDFSPSPSTDVTKVKVGCPDHVAFTGQPTTTLAGQIIDAGPGVVASIEDSANQVVTISSAAVGVAIGTNPAGGTLYGTSPANASNGLATFSDLIIDTSGTGYTLTASSSGLTSGTSSAFDVTGVAGKCTSTPCGTATGQHATSSDKTIGIASVPVGPCTSATLGCFVSLDESTGNFCGGPCAANVIVFAPPPNQNGTATLIIQYYKTVFQGNLALVHIYKLSNGVATQLFDCSATNPVPCVSDRSTVNGNAQFTVSLGQNDPFVGGK
jgi:hypothetical protein